MKQLQIQNEILKSIGKDKDVQCCIYEGNVYIALNGYVVYIIPEKAFYINTSFLKQSSLSDYFKNEPNVQSAKLTGEARLVGKETMIKIANESNYAWVNSKLLKFFDDIADFKITDYKSPVYIYSDGIVVGLVLPFRVDLIERR